MCVCVCVLGMYEDVIVPRQRAFCLFFSPEVGGFERAHVQLGDVSESVSSLRA